MVLLGDLLINKKTQKYSVEGIFATILFGTLFLTALFQVFTRIGLFTPPIWSEELSRWL